MPRRELLLPRRRSAARRAASCSRAAVSAAAARAPRWLRPPRWARATASAVALARASTSARFLGAGCVGAAGGASLALLRPPPRVGPRSGLAQGRALARRRASAAPPRAAAQRLELGRALRAFLLDARRTSASAFSKASRRFAAASSAAPLNSAAPRGRARRAPRLGSAPLPRPRLDRRRLPRLAELSAAVASARVSGLALEPGGRVFGRGPLVSPRRRASRAAASSPRQRSLLFRCARARASSAAMSSARAAAASSARGARARAASVASHADLNS